MNYFTKLIVSILIAISSAFAWEPTKPIHVIIAQAPISGNELVFRKMSELVTTKTKATFLIEHHAGMDGVIAWNTFSQRPNDGYHITVQVLEASWAALPTMFPTQLNTDPNQAILVTPLASAPLVFVVKNTSGIRTMQELITAYQTQKLNVGTSGAPAKLMHSMFSEHIKGNKNIQTIPYKGIIPNLTDLVAGATDISIVPAISTKALVEAGQIRIIAVADDRPLPFNHTIPLISDTIPNFTAKTTYTIFLPKDTPSEIVNWYIKNFSLAINDPAISSWLKDQWSLPFPNPSLESSRQIGDRTQQLLPMAKQFLKDSNE